MWENVAMVDRTANPAHPQSRAVRDVADGYVHALADLDPTVATSLGLRPGEDRLPDLSPAGQDALDDLARSTLAGLADVERAAAPVGDERRCARLLRRLRRRRRRAARVARRARPRRRGGERGRRRPGALARRVLPAAGAGRPGRRRDRALPGLRQTVDRGEPGPARGLRLGLVAVQRPAAADARRGAAGPARRVGAGRDAAP